MPYPALIGVIISGVVAYLMRDAKDIREHVNDLESELLSEDNEVLRTKLAEITGMNSMLTAMHEPPQTLAEPEEEDQALYMKALDKLTSEISQSIGEVYRLSGQIVEKAKQLPTRQLYALLTAAPPILTHMAASLFDVARSREPLISVDSFVIAILIFMVLLVVAIAYKSEEHRKEVCSLLFRRAKLVYTALGVGKPHEVSSYSRFCGTPSSLVGGRAGEPAPLSR